MRNLWRSPSRSIGIAAAVAVLSGGLLALTVALLAVGSGAGRAAGRLGADIVVVPRATTASAPTGGAPSTPYLDYALVDRLRQVQVIVPQYGGRPPLTLPGVAAASPQLAFNLPDEASPGTPGLRVVGFEPVSDLTVLPWLQRPLRRPLGPSDALLGHALARSSGTPFEVIGERLTVMGVLRQTGDENLDRSVFVQLPTAWRLLQRVGTGTPDPLPVAFARPVTSVMVRVRPDAEPQRVANFIHSALPEVEARVTAGAMVSLATHLRASVGNLAGVAVVIWVTTLLLVASAFSMVVRERQRELGLLRAMGATRGGIVALLATEVLTICTAGGVIGVAAALAALTAMESFFRIQLGLPYEWPGAGRLVALGLTCVASAPATGLLAALGPALRAAIREPHVAINEAR